MPSLPPFTGPVIATPQMKRMWNLHRQVATTLNILPSTLAHRKLKGTASVTGAGNTILTGSGPLNDPTDFSAQFQSTWSVWIVQQMFIRGEQKQDDFQFGISSAQLLQSQTAALATDGETFIQMEEDDFILDAYFANIWRVVNPVLSPDGSHYAFLLERQR